MVAPKPRFMSLNRRTVDCISALREPLVGLKQIVLVLLHYHLTVREEFWLPGSTIQ